jgi:hypothetical protein
MSAAPQIMISGHDSAKFSETHRADPAVGFETEGGWVLSRARFTRRPPVIYTLGFTDLSNGDKRALENLYNDARGSSEIISGWLHPISGDATPVRFVQGSVPNYQYKGFRGIHRWNVSAFMIEEV